MNVKITSSALILSGVASFKSAEVDGLLIFIKSACHKELISLPLGFFDIGGGVKSASSDCDGFESSCIGDYLEAAGLEICSDC